MSDETVVEVEDQPAAPAAPDVTALGVALRDKRLAAGVASAPQPRPRRTEQAPRPRIGAQDVQLGCADCGGSFPYSRPIHVKLGAAGEPVVDEATKLLVGEPIAPDPEVCPGCQRQRFEAESEASRRMASPTAPAEPSLLDRAHDAGGNPWAFKARFGDVEVWPDRREAYRDARAWAAEVQAKKDRYDSVRGLLLWGETGVMKSALSHAVLYELLAAGLLPGTGVMLDDWTTLTEKIRATYSAGEPTWPLIEARTNARVWICDDLFAGKVSAHAFRLAYTILNGREGKATMVTTNEPPAELPARYAFLKCPDVDRVYSRLGAFGVREIRSEVDGRFGGPQLQR
jgi:hypothetical protein